MLNRKPTILKTVLIIDDNIAIREALTLVLEAEGYKVLSAQKNDEVTQTLKGEVPAVVLLDREVRKIFRQNLNYDFEFDPKYQHIPIFYLNTEEAVFSPEEEMDTQHCYPLEVTALLSAIDQRIQTTNSSSSEFLN